MKTLVILLSSLISPSVMSATTVLHTKWVCWATSKTNQECGTYSLASKKSVAEKAAMKLCMKTCGLCFIEYCEKN